MTVADLHRWRAEFDELAARMNPLFYRPEPKRHAVQYLEGLLSPLEAKNGWTIAEHSGEKEPKATQRFLNLTPWDADRLRDLLQDYVVERMGDPGAILVADPTGFEKKGSKSAGVQRQYSGTLGRVGNCQIGTFLSYVTPSRDRALIDRALYIPQSWYDDRDRCAEAGIPAENEFATRPQQVQQMLAHARARGLPSSWFTADEEFGQNRGLCDWLETQHQPYVMAIPKDTHLTTTTGQDQRIHHLADELAESSWQRLSAGPGMKGPRLYDWAPIDSAHPDHQYMIRRSIDDGELAYYHCYNPHHAGFPTLVNVAGARWPIEECFGAGKNEVGLDDYQVRLYHAWYRHITLAMLAHAFLAVLAHDAKNQQPDQPEPEPNDNDPPTRPKKTPTRHPTNPNPTPTRQQD